MSKKIIVAADPRLIAANIAAVGHSLSTMTAVDDGLFIHDRIVAANASMFVEANFQEKLTTYAIGYKDPNNLDAACEFFAPAVDVPKRFEYASYSNVEEFLSDTVDDLRPIGADFKTVEYTSEKVQAKTENRGLKICVDTDQIAEKDNWQNGYVEKLMRRLKRNKLRRAVALLSAAAVNTAKTWDVTAGKDPDMDIIAEAVVGRTASGVGFNRIGYGDTAWQKRMLAHRAQASAGGFASSGLTAEQVAGLLAVDQVYVSKERYQSTATAKAQVVNNLVLMFNAMSGADTEDPSNIKDFVSNTDMGGRYGVYVRQVGIKLWEVAVEHYEKLAITSTLGIRQFTVS